MKKVLGFVVIVGIIAAIVLFLLGKGFGFGNGTGNGDGDAGAAVSNSQESSVESTEESVEQSSEAADELPQKIIIRIAEDKVYFNEKECADAEELKQLVEEANTDERTFELVDDNSILATYEWVVGVFKDLEIPLGQ